MSYRNAQGFVHDNAHIALFRTGILSFIVGYIGIVLTARTRVGSNNQALKTLGFHKKNILKIIGTCLLLICIGCAITWLGDYVSYADEGVCHNSALMPTGLLVSITGCIGIAFTALGCLLWVVWKCITTYVYRHK